MFNISIVSYDTDIKELEDIIVICYKSEKLGKVYLIDNSKTNINEAPLKNLFPKLNYIHNPLNPGYGSSHNIAIRETMSQGIEYHIVMNSDIKFNYSILDDMNQFMNENKEIGLLAPKIFNKNGSVQYSSKLLPNPIILILRAFIPSKYRNNLDYIYELRKSGYTRTFSSCYVSGCFMFFRCKTLERVGIFDERFFMYPEDIDISRRIADSSKVLFNPKFEICHDHRGESHKNLRMFFIHSLNMVRYFNKWGWFKDKKRKKINEKVLSQFENISSED